MLLGGSHVAHNCRLGKRVTLINNVLLGGYVEVEDGATFGGGAVVHQFARIGELAMVPGNARVVRDVVPFAMTDVEGRMAGLNRVGLRRAEFPADHIKEIRDAYRLLFNPIGGIMPDFIKSAEQLTSPPVGRLVQFVSRPSKRGIAGRARRGSSRLEFRGHEE